MRHETTHEQAPETWVRVVNTFAGVRCYSAWRRGAACYQTITTSPDGYVGRVGTEFPPAEITAMAPGSPERIEAAAAWQAARYADAYAAIIAAYPEAADGVRRMGEIEVQR